MLNFKSRESGIDENFKTEVGDDILRIDWTNGAATRCREKHLLNIMDGQSRILTFRFTCNAKRTLGNKIQKMSDNEANHNE